MENDANVADPVRKTFEAYTEALSAVVKALEKSRRRAATRTGGWSNSGSTSHA